LDVHLYYITDRTQLRSQSLDACIRRTIAAGVDWVQIREKDLPARGLLGHAQAAVEQAQAQPRRARVIINDRMDVALAAKADGVHLGTSSMPAETARRLSPRGFLIGVSCHSLAEAVAAEAAGANYLLFGPIFETPSKLPYGPPLGIDKLREATSRVGIPVFALGGINAVRVRVCLENGAAGIAGIRLFQDCQSVEELVRKLREKQGGSRTTPTVSL